MLNTDLIADSLQHTWSQLCDSLLNNTIFGEYLEYYCNFLVQLFEGFFHDFNIEGLSLA